MGLHRFDWRAEVTRTLARCAVLLALAAMGDVISGALLQMPYPVLITYSRVDTTKVQVELRAVGCVEDVTLKAFGGTQSVLEPEKVVAPFKSGSLVTISPGSKWLKSAALVGVACTLQEAPRRIRL